MISLEISESISSSLDPEIMSHARLDLAVQETLRFASVSAESSLTILISDDDQLRQLNRQFLGIDETTDVLSFPAGYVDPDTHTTYLGDVIISYPRAAEQAAGAGNTAEDELRLLAVHGTLHLLGYDHADAEDEARMWQVQGDILERMKRNA
jgi:probable rRNA maturation factor